MSITTVSDTPVQTSSRHVWPRAASPEILLSADDQREARRDLWNDRILNRLIQWELGTEDLEDDDMIAPSPAAMARAIKLARHWRDAGEPCPIDVIPNRDGGILFQCEKTTQFELSINVREDGSLDRLEFRGANPVVRQHVP